MTDRETVDAAGERGLIEGMADRVPHRRSPLGPGDDAAVLPAETGGRVVTADAMVEGVHFLRAHPPRWLGWKLLAVNLSDVNAMGARPEAFVLTAALPRQTPLVWWNALADGLGELAREAGVELAGGDVVRSPGPVALTVTAWGRLGGLGTLRRDGGRPGDLLMVAGPVGRSGVGLERWLALEHGDGWPGEPPPGLDPAIRWHLRPEPPLEAGPFALAQGARAGMDLSDGVAADAARLATASDLRVVVDLDRLPVDPPCGEATPDQRVASGEDLGLLVLVPPERREDFEREGFVRLGWAESGRPEVSWRRAGRPTRLRGVGFEHFSTSGG